MSEEKEPGFFAQIKNQIIAGVGVVVTAAGGLIVSNMEAIFSPAEEATEVVAEAIQQPNIVINVPEAKKDTVVKVIKEKAKPKLTETEKRKKEGLDW